MEVTEAVSAALAARNLMRAARVATLATSDAGQPFASLVTPTTAVDGSVLLLLSDLSPHTRHLRAEPRCSLLFAGAPAETNPQTAPRVTVLGAAVPEPDPALKARWVALHPYAAFYADFGDFRLWRVRPAAAHYVGGFASAHRLQGAELLPDPDTAARIAVAEPEIIARCNADHPDATARIVACDGDGFDLASGETVLRVPFPAPVGNPEAVQAALQLARNGFASVAGPRV